MSMLAFKASKLFCTSLGLGSTSTGRKPETYLTKTGSRNRCASGPAHTSDFLYINIQYNIQRQFIYSGWESSI